MHFFIWMWRKDRKQETEEVSFLRRERQFPAEQTGSSRLKQRFRDISSMTTMGSFLPFRKSSCPGTCFLPEGIKRICFFPQQNMMKGMERDTIPVLS